MYSAKGGNAASVFEPDDEYKGDFARTYFYMATCYQNLTWKYTYMVSQNDYPTLNNWSIDLLMQWHYRLVHVDGAEGVVAFRGVRRAFRRIEVVEVDITYMVSQNDYPTLNNWSIDLLMQWHRMDPVSQKEVDRNEAVYGF